MSYIFFSILATTSFAFGTLISKFASRHTVKTWDAILTVYAGTFTLIALLVTPFLASITLPGDAIRFVALNSLTALGGYIFFFKGMLKLDASVMTPLFQFQAAAIVFLAYLFIGERFAPISYLWMLVIVMGSVLVSLDEQMSIKSFVNKSIGGFLIAMIFFAASNIFVTIAARDIGAMNTVFWTAVVNAVWLIPFVIFRKPKINLSLPKLSPLFAGGLFQYIGVSTLVIAFEQNVSVTGVLSMLSSPIAFVIAIISSIFYPKLLEHHSPKVYAFRGLGLVIILFGAIRLTLGQ